MAENPGTSGENHAYTSTDQESTDSKSSHESSGRKLFKKLMELCKELEDDKEMEIIIKKLGKKFDECSSAYRRSKSFCNLMEEKIATVKKYPDHKFLHLKNVSDELKANKKSAKSKLEKKDDSSKAEKLAEKSVPAEDSSTQNLANSETKDNAADTSAVMDDISSAKLSSKSTENGEISDIGPSLETNFEASSSKVSDPPVSDSKVEKSTSKAGSTKKHGDDNGKTQRLIERIEITISKLNWKIQELEKQEIDLGALSDDEDSAYIQKSKYENRICELHKKLCKLKKETVDRKSSKAIRFSGTKYPDVDRAVEKFYNRKREFPNFPDIMKVVKVVNSEKNLNLDNEKIHQVAKEAFKELGNQLKRIRQYELHAHITGFLTDAELTEMDPAKTDKELERKLLENKKIYQNKMEEVINVYAEKQNEINVEEILKTDAEIVESGVTSPTASSHEDDSEAETENGIENEIEEVEKEIGDEDSDEESEEIEDMEEGTIEEDEQENGSENQENMNEDLDDAVDDVAMNEDINEKNQGPDTPKNQELETDTIPEDITNEEQSSIQTKNALNCDLENKVAASDTLSKAEDIISPVSVENMDTSKKSTITSESQGMGKMDSPENGTITTEESEEKEFQLPVLTDEDMTDNKDSYEPEEALCMEVDEESDSEGYTSSDTDDKIPESNIAMRKEKLDENSTLKKESQAKTDEKNLSDLNTRKFSAEDEESGKENSSGNCNQKAKISLLADEENEIKSTHELEQCLVEQDSFIAIEKNLKELESALQVVAKDFPIDSPKDPSVQIVEEDIFIASSSGDIFLSPNKKKTVIHSPAESKQEDSKLNTCQKIMRFDECLDESKEEAKSPKNPMMPLSVTEKNSVFVVSSCGSTFVVPRKEVRNLIDDSNPSSPSHSADGIISNQPNSANKTDIFDKYKGILKECCVKIVNCDDLVAKYERRRKRRLKPIETVAISILSSCESDDSMSDSRSARRKRRNSSSSDSDFDPHASGSKKKKKKRRTSRHQMQPMQLFKPDKQAAYDSDDIIVLDEVPPKKKGSEEIVVEPDTNSLLGILNAGPSRSNIQFSAHNYPKQRGNISITPVMNVQRPVRNLAPKPPVRIGPVRIPMNNTRYASPIRPLVQMKRPNTFIPGAPTVASQNYRPNVSRYQPIRPLIQQQNISQIRTLPRGGLVQQQRSFQTNARQFNGANGNVLQKQAFATYQMRHTAPKHTTTSVINNRNVQVVTKTVTQVKTVVQQQQFSQQTISTAPNQNRLAVNNLHRRKQQILPRNNVQKSGVLEDVITID